jgi:hypothetical protein
MEVNKDGFVEFLNEEQILTRQKNFEKKKNLLKEKKERYSNFFDNPTGIEFLKEVLNKSGLFTKHSCFYSTNNSTDPLKIAFSDGYRELFLEILNLLEDKLLIKIIKND